MLDKTGTLFEWVENIGEFPLMIKHTVISKYLNYEKLPLNDNFTNCNTHTLRTLIFLENPRTRHGYN